MKQCFECVIALGFSVSSYNLLYYELHLVYHKVRSGDNPRRGQKTDKMDRPSIMLMPIDLLMIRKGHPKTTLALFVTREHQLREGREKERKGNVADSDFHEPEESVESQNNNSYSCTRRVCANFSPGACRPSRSSPSPASRSHHLDVCSFFLFGFLLGVAACCERH